MQQHVWNRFLHEIALQCDYADYALREMEAAYDRGDVQILFYHLHGWLSATAAISKMLWPSSTASVARERGESLRESLGLADSSALQSRTLRNHFEHFDERLDTWATTAPGIGYADMNLGPIVFPDFSPEQNLRQLDHTTGRASFFGDVFELDPIVSETRALRRLVAKKLAGRV